MKITWIRHGRTMANEQHLYCGNTDVMLSQTGKRELIEEKKKCLYPKAQLFVVSGMIRTIQTAQILYDDPVYIELEQLREINFGIFEMSDYKSLKDKEAYQIWIADTKKRSPEGGESGEAFLQRVMEGVRRVEALVREQGIESTVVVTHGGVIAVVMEQLFPKERHFYEWQPECGEGYTISYENNGDLYYKKIEKA